MRNLPWVILSLLAWLWPQFGAITQAMSIFSCWHFWWVSLWEENGWWGKVYLAVGCGVLPSPSSMTGDGDITFISWLCLDTNSHCSEVCQQHLGPGLNPSHAVLPLCYCHWVRVLRLLSTCPWQGINNAVFTPGETVCMLRARFYLFTFPESSWVFKSLFHLGIGSLVRKAARCIVWVFRGKKCKFFFGIFKY